MRVRCARGREARRRGRGTHLASGVRKRMLSFASAPATATSASSFSKAGKKVDLFCCSSSSTRVMCFEASCSVTAFRLLALPRQNSISDRGPGLLPSFRSCTQPSALSQSEQARMRGGARLVRLCAHDALDLARPGDHSSLHDVHEVHITLHRSRSSCSGRREAARGEPSAAVAPHGAVAAARGRLVRPDADWRHGQHGLALGQPHGDCG